MAIRPRKARVRGAQAALFSAALLASVPHPGASQRPPQPPPPAQGCCAPLPMPAARAGTSGTVQPPRRWCLQQARSDCGSDRTRAMLPGGERPLPRAWLPGPPRFMELRWEPGLQPGFCWHGAVLTGALGTESSPISPRWRAAATGRTPGCCWRREGCVQARGSC